jgi:hypothetical protein
MVIDQANNPVIEIDRNSKQRRYFTCDQERTGKWNG